MIERKLASRLVETTRRVEPVTETAEGSPAGPAGLLDELRWRGILEETTPGLAGRLATGRPIAGYIGFDPSADSLHVGHLVPDLRAPAPPALRRAPGRASWAAGPG